MTLAGLPDSGFLNYNHFLSHKRSLEDLRNYNFGKKIRINWSTSPKYIENLKVMIFSGSNWGLILMPVGEGLISIYHCSGNFCLLSYSE